RESADEPVRALLAMALQQFAELEMTGWTQRAEALLHEPEVSEGVHHVAAEGDAHIDAPSTASGSEHAAIHVAQSASGAVFCREGEYWTLAFEGRVVRLKDAKGLHYIAHLLRHPGNDFHVCELAALVQDASPIANGRRTVGQTVAASLDSGLHVRGPGDAGPLLDAKAKADYKRRLDDLREE